MLLHPHHPCFYYPPHTVSACWMKKLMLYRETSLSWSPGKVHTHNMSPLPWLKHVVTLYIAGTGIWQYLLQWIMSLRWPRGVPVSKTLKGNRTGWLGWASFLSCFLTTTGNLVIFLVLVATWFNFLQTLFSLQGWQRTVEQQKDCPARSTFSPSQMRCVHCLVSSGTCVTPSSLPSHLLAAINHRITSLEQKLLQTSSPIVDSEPLTHSMLMSNPLHHSNTQRKTSIFEDSLHLSQDTLDVLSDSEYPNWQPVVQANNLTVTTLQVSWLQTC